MPCYGCNKDQNGILGLASVLLLPCYGCRANKSQDGVLIPAYALLRLLRQQEPRRHSRPRVCLATDSTARKAKKACSSPRQPCSVFYGNKSRTAFSPRRMPSYGCYCNNGQDGILVPTSALLRLLREPRRHPRPRVCHATGTKAKKTLLRLLRQARPGDLITAPEKSCDLA